MTATRSGPGDLEGWLVRVADGVAGWFSGVDGGEAVARALLGVLPLVGLFAGCFALATWAERKVLARIQNRIGPNRVGPVGLFQPVADGLKMLGKEDIVPEAADRALHLLAPVLVVMPALVVLTVLPVGRDFLAARLDSAVLVFFAVGSVGTLAVFMAGWSSRNKYSLLGAMRVIAQVVSYEMPLLLAAVPVVMAAGSMDTAAIVQAQMVQEWIQGDNLLLAAAGGVAGWNVWTPWGLAGFALFFIASLAEVNRSPFDLPEADSELIAGHLTEFSGFKYALFFLAEYVSVFAIAGLAVTLFLGGWSGPNVFWPGASGADEPGMLVPSALWFLAKVWALVGVMFWIRGTFPRLRVDQLMGFAWKALVPLALGNLVVAAVFLGPWPPAVRWVGALAVLAALVRGLAWMHRGAAPRAREYRYA